MEITSVTLVRNQSPRRKGLKVRVVAKLLGVVAKLLGVVAKGGDDDMPFWKRLCLTALDSRFEVRRARQLLPLEEVNKRVTDLATTQMQDAHELHIRDMVNIAFRRIHALEAGDRAHTRDAGPKDGPADVEHEANKNSINADDNHDSRRGGRRQNVARAYTVGLDEKKEYGGSY
nr:hypothetical protein [Tanacetum cinerariifolium]